MDFAARLKRIRTNLGMSVRALADRVGVSPSFIYQLEKGETAPSFSTLKKISSVLGVSVSVLTEDELPEEWFIVRGPTRKRLVLGTEGVEVELFSFLGSREKRMQAIHFRMRPGCACREIIFTHERDDFIYITEGTVELRLGERWYRLESGDAAHLSFQNLNEIRNPGNVDASGIWVVSPVGS